MAGPLAGIRVIDYSHFLAGPHMSRCLGAMGAEVIKVERPTSGDAGRGAATGKQPGSGTERDLGSSRASRNPALA